MMHNVLIFKFPLMIQYILTMTESRNVHNIFLIAFILLCVLLEFLSELLRIYGIMA